MLADSIGGGADCPSGGLFLPQALAQRDHGNGTKFPNDDPSSGLHRFLADIEHPTEDSVVVPTEVVSSAIG